MPRDLAEIWTDKSIYGILIVVFYGGIIGLFFEIIGRFYGFVKIWSMKGSFYSIVDFSNNANPLDK